MRAALTAAPLLAVIVALLLGRSSRTAAVAGLVVAVPLVFFVFPVGRSAVAEAGLDWGPVVLEVVLVLGGGILFAEAGRSTGNQEEIARWVTRSLGTGIVPVLAIVHGFTPLTESLTGYGIGAALAVPLLLGLGLSGRRAAVIGLLGLCAVPWGSMGPGTLIASQLTGVDFDDLGVTTALFNLAVVGAVGAAAALLVAEPGRRVACLLAAAGSALTLWLAVLATNVLIGTAPAGAIGGLLTLLLHLTARAVRGHRIRVTRAVVRAGAPYAVVLGGMLAATVLFRAANAEGSAAEAIVGSPAFWLFTASGLLLAVHPRHLRPALRAALPTWGSVAPSTTLFIVLGALMGLSGMSEVLADQLARLGASYLFLLPLFAVLVGFITGSNSGANALAAGAQAEVARVLGADIPLAMGAHNSAGAAAMMASPARVELATRLARVPSAYRAVQRTLLLVLGCVAVAMGFATLLLL
ncbi:L-lactate permease [Leucobacter sp. wl10]|uniref:L-lactate permease n=1 Tax=Leucobacter sp. wl10 TaxID=2304677 RepID=UPI000E5ADFF4|nr:L-lactate permease [Leucobacter sp. wl10]RGE21004.1 L-lactate permease [Leucobacter sp. wl10]